MRYELQPIETKTGNAILYTDLDNQYVTRDKPYLVIGQDKDIVNIIDNSFKENKSWGSGKSRRFIKETTIEHAVPGDDIIFLKDMDYGSVPKQGNPKKGQIFTITNIQKDGTINYGLHIDKTFEYGVQPEDVIILKTIKDIPITDYIVDISNTLVNERLELRQVMLDNDQEFDSILHENRIRSMFYAKMGVLRCAKNRWFGVMTSIDKPNISCKDFIDKFKKKSDDEKQIIQENIQPIQIKKQNKEAIMPFQDIINSIFGVSDYDKKPKFLVTIYNPDGSEHANATAENIEDIKQKAATDYRLIGHKIVAYKLHSEITTEIPVVVTRLKDEKSKEDKSDNNKSTCDKSKEDSVDK